MHGQFAKGRRLCSLCAAGGMVAERDQRPTSPWPPVLSTQSASLSDDSSGTPVAADVGGPKARQRLPALDRISRLDAAVKESRRGPAKRRSGEREAVRADLRFRTATTMFGPRVYSVAPPPHRAAGWARCGRNPGAHSAIQARCSARAAKTRIRPNPAQRCGRVRAARRDVSSRRGTLREGSSSGAGKKTGCSRPRYRWSGSVIKENSRYSAVSLTDLDITVGD